MDGYLDGSTVSYAGRIEVIEGRTGRRLRSEAERARIAAESLAPGVPPRVLETPDCDYAAIGSLSIWSRRNWSGERWPCRSISQLSL